MYQRQYQAQQLISFLEAIQNKGASGTLRINAAISPTGSSRTCIVVWQNGEVTYCDRNLPDLPRFAQQLIAHYKPGTAEAAVKFAREKAIDPVSARELFSILCRIRVVSWEQIESFVRDRSVIALEQVLPYTGQLEFTPAIEFDLTYGEGDYGFDLSNLKQQIARRQQEWLSLNSHIPSMEAIPKQGDNSELIDRDVKQHIRQWVDGKRSLIDIAQQLNKDPLQIASTYKQWVEAGWVTFGSDNSKPIETTVREQTKEKQPEKKLLTVLSVDDSPIIQTMVKRALSDRYNVLLASNAVEALNILDRNQVQLILLDVTMPDIDGLEMCRTLRSIPKFSKLPIIMLTARDTLVDKMKGQIAGTNRYLIKPFDAETLLSVVGEFLGQEEVGAQGLRPIQ